MAWTSKSGMWRVVNLYIAARNGYPITVSRYGRFACADFASLILFKEGFEEKVKEQVQSCKGLFVDVGANIGFYSIMAAKNGNDVIAFEPNPKAYSSLITNINYNDMNGKVQTYNSAAWSKAGWVSLKLGRHTDVTQVVPVAGSTLAVTLDDMLYGKEPSLIKIDAEGSECDVLKGAQETLLGHPKVVFEAWDEEHFKSALRFFPRGYTFKRLDRINYLAS